MIAFDATSNGGTTGTSHTHAHTCSGVNRILRVGVGIESASDLVTGGTYNGVALTLIDKQQNAVANEWAYLFELVAPAPGANDIVVSASSSVAIRCVAASYTVARQIGQPDASSKATSTATTSQALAT